MSVKTIERAGLAAWSPVADAKSMIAVGGSGTPTGSDFTTSHDLEIYSFDSITRSEGLSIVARQSVDHAFRSIAWADIGAVAPLGVIAGGLSNGVVSLWDAGKLISPSQSSPNQNRSASALLFSQNLHADRAVTCMEFNPQKPTLLATGGCDGSVQVINVERPGQPDIFRGVTTTKHANSEVVSVSWNRKVQHILASASNQGVVVVWDLKNKKEVVTIKDPGNRTRCSSLSWNPDVPTQLLVAYNDDNNPCIQLWDMRNCSYPFREFQEHSRGVTCASFCDMDANLMVSSGRDNRGICWSLHSGQLDAYADLNLPSPAVKLDWSPHLPGFIAASQSSGVISIHSISQRQSPVASRYPPKWTKMPCGVAFGFGGKLVTFGSKQASRVQIHVVPDEPAVIQEADKFEGYLATDLRPFCDTKANESHDDHERLTWNLISLLFQGAEARPSIVSALGVDSREIQAIVEKYLGRTANVGKPPANADASFDHAEHFSDAGNLNADQLDDLFDQLARNSEQQATGGSALPSRRGTPRAAGVDGEDQLTVTDWSQGPEAIIKQALLVGDISSAVECCMKCARYADALFLAGAGGPDLWKRARDEYARKQKDPFIRQIGYIMSDDLEKFVLHSDLNSWVETLAILVTYSNRDTFGRLVEMLAERLEKERFDVRSAVLCYLSCGSFSNTVRIWASMSNTQGSQSQALQGLVEKMSCLFTATRPGSVDSVFSHKMQQYATLLANSGRIMAAMRCLILVPDSTETRILKDRIYNAAPSAMGQLLRNPPPFPFDVADIRPLPSIQQNANIGVRVGQNQPLVAGQPHAQTTPNAIPQRPGFAHAPPTSQPHFPMPSPPAGMPPSMPPAGYQQSAPVPPPSIPVGVIPRVNPPAMGIAHNPPSSGPSSFGIGMSQPMNASSGVPKVGTPSSSPSNLASRMGPPVSGGFAPTGMSTGQQPPQAANPAPPVISRPPPSTSTIPQRAPSPAMGIPVPVTQPTMGPPPVMPPSASGPMTPMSNSPQRGFAPQPPNVTPGGPPPVLPPTWAPSPASQSIPPPMAQAPMPVGPAGFPTRPVAGPPTSGGVSTAPHATANPITPGLPTSWPVPNPVQQQLSPSVVPPPKSAMMSMGPVGEPVPGNEIASIQRSLSALLDRCAQDGNRRKWEDIGKKLNELYEKLASGQITRESVAKIKEMCACIDQGDYMSASRLRVELSASDWERNRTWLFAVQLLLPK